MHNTLLQKLYKTTMHGRHLAHTQTTNTTTGEGEEIMAVLNVDFMMLATFAMAGILISSNKVEPLARNAMMTCRAW